MCFFVYCRHGKLAFFQGGSAWQVLGVYGEGLSLSLWTCPFLDISYTQNYTTCGLCVWVFSPSIMFSRLIHVVTRGSTSFLSIAECHSCMPMPRSVCAFILGAALGCFSRLAVVRGAAQIFVWTCFYFVWADT